MITHDDVLAARRRTAGHVRRTPLLRVSDTMAFKLELTQVTGTFKARGAANRLLTALEDGELAPGAGRGVVVASGGNAGLANAWAATALGLRSDVFVPETAPAVKVALLERHGARVHRAGTEYAESAAAAADFAQEHGSVLGHAYDQPAVVAGAGGVGLEVLEDLPDVDTVVVAVGGGGLFAGVAAAVEGRARVVAVEPERAPALHAALAAGEPVDVEVGGVAADSLGARRAGTIAFDVARRTSPVSVLVADDAIVAARRDLWDAYRLPSEHGAAAAHAALLSGTYVPAPDERVCVVACGANTDLSTLA